MLVLSRKCHETLLIGGTITVTILEVRGGRVRLGIEAPTDVAVHRLEVAQRQGRAGQGTAATSAAVAVSFLGESTHDRNFC